MIERHTYLVTSRLARNHALLEAARAQAHGRQILSPAQAAARLTGGFLQAVDYQTLKEVLHEVLKEEALDLGELNAIRDLPGMVRAAARTLQKVWVAEIDLAAFAEGSDNQRLTDLMRLESAVCERLPASMRRSKELVDLAIDSLEQAPTVLGPIMLTGISDLDPVWRPLLNELAEVVPVTWHLGHFDPPLWLEGTKIQVVTSAAAEPGMIRVACANPRHEALEALRWARELIVTGTARPEEIAIAAPATEEWDGHLVTIAADASLPVAFSGGRPALTTRDGQAAAALAEVLLNGLGQNRMRRLLSLVRGMTSATAKIPSSWHRIVPRDAPLLQAVRWQQLIEKTLEWPEGESFGAELSVLIETLDHGINAADEIGETILSGRALAIWRRALQEGPARALDVSLSAIRVDEDLDPNGAIIWCSAADLAACPRPFTRLLGLTSRGWPRTDSEDPLLPAHVIDPAILDPVPVPERDRRDFQTICRATARHLVLSRSRRDAEDRQTGESPLLRLVGIKAETYLRRERVPEHATSEADRLLARSDEFKGSARSTSAVSCWRNWHIPELTAHDGLLRADHPVIRKTLSGPFSATGLRKLARDPLGYVWTYTFGWDAPAEDDEPLSLDPLQFGALSHRAMELALTELEGGGGFAQADPAQITTAVETAVARAGEEYEATQPVPPRLIWNRQLAEVCQLALVALTWEEQALPGQRSFAEVPFGRRYRETRSASDLPWNPEQEVRILGTDLTIAGVIDRLDISGDGAQARVTDYKTGRIPKDEIVVNGGAELQRCLYAYAVQALKGGDVEVAARLLYPRDEGRLLDLEDPRAILDAVAKYLVAARDNLVSGNALIGVESGERDDNPLTFALPGNAKEIYFEIKRPAVGQRLAPLPELWEMS